MSPEISFPPSLPPSLPPTNLSYIPFLPPSFLSPHLFLSPSPTIPTFLPLSLFPLPSHIRGRAGAEKAAESDGGQEHDIHAAVPRPGGGQCVMYNVHCT